MIPGFIQHRVSFTLTAVVITICCAVTACAPTQRTPKLDDTDDGQTIVIEWRKDIDCTVCHEYESTSLNDSTCAASAHSDETCIDCHDDLSRLTTLHKGVSGPRSSTTLRKTNVTEGACLSCHDSWEELALKTLDCTLIADHNGTVINPHAYPETGDHAIISCVSCHDIHVVQRPQISICISCHHEEVFECFTCHE